MSTKRNVAVIGIFLLALILGLTVRSSAGATGMRWTQAPSCEQILSNALATLDETCDGLGRNKACYGNNAIQSQPVENVSLKFDTVGDKAPIQAIKSIATSPLDLQGGTWGLALLKLQANL